MTKEEIMEVVDNSDDIEEACIELLSKASIKEIKSAWPQCPLTDKPFWVCAIGYRQDEEDEDDIEVTDDEIEFGEFETYEEALKCVESIKSIPEDKVKDDSTFFVVEIETVIYDDDGESTVNIDTLYEIDVDIE